MLGGLAAFGSGTVGATSPGATVLPTVRCAVTAGIDGQRYPSWPARQGTNVPASMADALAAYVGGLQRVVAPRGWTCGVLEAVNGSNVITVAKRGKGSVPTIKSWSEPACVGCMFDAVCRYFPREAAPLNVGLPCSRATPGDRVTRLARTLVRVDDRSGSTFSLVFFEPRGALQRAAGVTCFHARRICEAVLADWRAQKH